MSPPPRRSFVLLSQQAGGKHPRICFQTALSPAPASGRRRGIAVSSTTTRFGALMEKSVRGVTSTPQNRRLLWRRRTALTHLRSGRSMSRCASCLLRRPNCLQRKKMEGPSARMGARIVMILTSALRCRPLAEVAPVARRHHQSPPTISPLLSACLDSAIDHATQLNLVHLNSPWFFSTQHFNSTWSVSTQHPNSTFQFNLATQ